MLTLLIFNNPDLEPSVSINRRIVGILMFNDSTPASYTFPMLLMSPKVLLTDRAYEGDLPEHNDPDFDDWVDQMHGFLHILNAFTSNPHRQPRSRICTFGYRAPATRVTIFINAPPADNAEATPSDSDAPSAPLVPRSDKTVRADDRLVQVFA